MHILMVAHPGSKVRIIQQNSILILNKLVQQYKMNRQYYKLYRSKSLNHSHLKQNILEIYSQNPQNLPLNLDQVLYHLDQKCQGRKADRDISVELFNQTADSLHKATLEAVVTKYIQNLETSQLCLKRDLTRLKLLTEKAEQVQSRERAFIFLKLVQASIYSKFTRQPVLQYKIVPTDIPAVSLANAINPVLNHEFILEMEELSFDLVFQQSGIQIYRWSFPDRPNLPEGEYHRVITSQNISFQVMVKYLPEGNKKGRETFQGEIQKLKKQIQRQQAVFKKLCNFQPFLSRKQAAAQILQGEGDFHLLLNCLPFLKQHLKVSYWLTIVLVVLECWSASIWPMQFLDIILGIYLLGILADLQFKDYSMGLLVIQLSMALLVLKSIWGLVSQPYFNKAMTNRCLIIVCMSFKILLILVLSIVRSRQYQIQHQKRQFVFGKTQVQRNEVDNKMQLNIWDQL